jgi:hypothetical protein
MLSTKKCATFRSPNDPVKIEDRAIVKWQALYQTGEKQTPDALVPGSPAAGTEIGKPAISLNCRFCSTPRPV